MAEIEVATNGSDTLWIEKGPNGITIGISASDGTSSHHLQVPVTSEEASKAVAFLTEPTDPTLKNEPAIRCQLRAALENMYMFGGMPKPDPKYNEYLNRMLEIVVAAAKDKEPATNEEFRQAAEEKLHEAADLLDRIAGLSDASDSDLDSAKMSVEMAASEVHELDLEQ